MSQEQRSATGPSTRFFVETEGPCPALQIGDDPRFRLQKLRLLVPGLASELRGFRMLWLSDIHLRARWPVALGLAISRAMREHPRMTLITGDFVESKVDHTPALPWVRRLLSEVRTEFGTFAILGNHDGRSLPGDLVGEPVTFIEQRRMSVGPGGGIELIGFPGFSPDDLDLAGLSVPESGGGGGGAWGEAGDKGGGCRIVLCHYPRLVREAMRFGPHLFLAGHTHGGQVCLPTGRPLITHDSLPRRYASGVHAFGGTTLAVSRGFGCSGPELRMFCPPEIYVIELQVAG
jgi:uncharacterized protein